MDALRHASKTSTRTRLTVSSRRPTAATASASFCQRIVVRGGHHAGTARVYPLLFAYAARLDDFELEAAGRAGDCDFELAGNGTDVDAGAIVEREAVRLLVRIDLYAQRLGDAVSERQRYIGQKRQDCASPHEQW